MLFYLIDIDPSRAAQALDDKRIISQIPQCYLLLTSSSSSLKSNKYWKFIHQDKYLPWILYYLDELLRIHQSVYQHQHSLSPKIGLFKETIPPDKYLAHEEEFSIDPTEIIHHRKKLLNLWLYKDTKSPFWSNRYPPNWIIEIGNEKNKNISSKE